MSFALGEIAAALKVMDIISFILMSIFIFLAGKIKKISMLYCVFLCAVFIFANTSYDSYDNRVKKWNNAEGTEVVVTGNIDRIDEKEKTAKLYIDDIYVSVYLETLGNAEIGNYVRITGTTGKFENGRNPGNFSEQLYCNSMGYTRKIEAIEVDIIDGKRNEVYAFLQKLREKYVNSIYSVWDKNTADTICAITVGVRDNLSDEVIENYRITGISHILAISGIHLSIVGMMIFKLFRKRFRYIVSGIVSISVIILFGMMIGDSASINRALIMFSMNIFAQILGRSYDLASAAALAAVLLMLDCPYVIYNSGFLLSFSAIAGICIGSAISDNGVVVLLCIQTFTLPMTMLLYYEIPLYGFVVNLIAVPLMSLVLISGFLSGIVGMFSIAPARFIAGIGYIILQMYEFIAYIVKKMPYNNIVSGQPKIYVIVIFYVSVLVISYFVIRRKPYRILTMYIVAIIFILMKTRNVVFYVSAIDVGQGDCILIHNDNGAAYMIDAGSSDVENVYKYRIQSYLKASGIGRLDGVIVTHMDADHINAVKELLNDNMVDCLYLPDIEEHDDSYAELEQSALQKNIKVVYLHKDMKIVNKKLSLICLYPGKNMESDDKNELSTVMRIEYEDFSMMCMGDLGSEGEQNILDENIECDVIKLGHHGSKNSSCDAFLGKSSPEYGLISSGVDNRYGHPHKETIERLNEHNISYINTAMYGEVRVTYKRGRYYVSGYLQ